MRAHRTLRGYARYHHCVDETDHCAQYAKRVTEPLIGVYENPQEAGAPTIAITEDALYVLEAGDPERIAFDDITSTQAPPEKADASEIRVALVDGSFRVLRICGGEGQFRDLYDFLRFLDRVLADRRRRVVDDESP